MNQETRTTDGCRSALSRGMRSVRKPGLFEPVPTGRDVEGGSHTEKHESDEEAIGGTRLDRDGFIPSASADIPGFSFTPNFSGRTFDFYQVLFGPAASGRLKFPLPSSYVLPVLYQIRLAGVLRFIGSFISFFFISNQDLRSLKSSF